MTVGTEEEEREIQKFARLICTKHVQKIHRKYRGCVFRRRRCDHRNQRFKRECRHSLSSLRPSPEDRFSGGDSRIDFEVHIAKLNRAMKIEGITDGMKVHEMNYWCPRLEMCSLHFYKENATVQLMRIKEELTHFYGNTCQIISQKGHRFMKMT